MLLFHALNAGLQRSFAELVDWEPSEDSFAGFHKKIMDESASICPFLGQALFRFFGEAVKL